MNNQSTPTRISPIAFHKAFSEDLKFDMPKRLHKLILDQELELYNSIRSKLLYAQYVPLFTAASYLMLRRKNVSIAGFYLAAKFIGFSAFPMVAFWTLNKPSIDLSTFNDLCITKRSTRQKLDFYIQRAAEIDRRLQDNKARSRNGFFAYKMSFEYLPKEAEFLALYKERYYKGKKYGFLKDFKNFTRSMLTGSSRELTYFRRTEYDFLLFALGVLVPYKLSRMYRGYKLRYPGRV